MLPRLKRMWRTCFEDTEQGADLVFSRLLTPGQMLVWADNSGRPVGMVNWKLLRFTTPRTSFVGAYVFGVATLPEYRGRGISRGLMSELHTVLSDSGAALACLVPASPSLFEFYARQGFESFFSRKQISVEESLVPVPSGKGVLAPARLPRLEALRGEAFGDSALFGAWDSPWLDYTDRECRLQGGETLRFTCRGKTGYCVCRPEQGGTLLVREAAIDKEDLAALVCALHDRYNARRYELRFPKDFPAGELPCDILPFGMVKWYDEEKRRLVMGGMGGAPWFAFGLD
jgi:GNAT superfamily N-acetyltransferase